MWGGGNEREILDAILPQNGHILATLGMENQKCGYIGCISGWLGSLSGAPSVTDGGLKVSGYRLIRWKWERWLRYDFTTEWAHTSSFRHGERKMWLSWVYFWLVWRPGGALRVTDDGLRVLGYSVGRRKWERRLTCDFTTEWALTSHFGHGQRRNVVNFGTFLR